MTSPPLTVTFVFSDEQTLQEFTGWMSDGGGEDSFDPEGGVGFDYTECFPAWGWDGTSPRRILVPKGAADD